MKTASEIYPQLLNQKIFYGVSDYQPIIESFGKILIQVDDTDYSGDTRVLLESNGQYGVLIFGWGSCSGCDRLQACDSLLEVDSLIIDLSNSIRWFDDIAALSSYALDQELHQTQFYWHSEETKAFIEKIKAFTTNA